MPIEKILVGTDYSENAEAAVALGLRLASAHGAELTVAHALAPPEPPVVLEGGRDYYVKKLEDQVAAVKEQMEATGSPVRVEVSLEVADGFAPAQLSRLARESGADLLLVATHGRTGFRRLLLGSVAERVVRVTETDVLVVRPRSEPGGAFRRILVPTDFSAIAQGALEPALELVAPGGTVELFHAWQPTEDTEPAQLRTKVERAGEALVSRFGAEEGRLFFTHAEDAPVRAICERLEEGPYDLVVMGSHGRRGFRRLILGSVAEATARYAPCSVLVVHGGGERTKEI